MPPTKRNLMGGVDFKIPNVSYCKDTNDVHFNPYNLIEFYVGEITGTTPQTVSIYTDKTNHLDVTINEGNKWYTYVLPKEKGLHNISGDTVTKVRVKADITTNRKRIIPSSTIEASFKGSNTSNVTDMGSMFQFCNRLTSLDVSNFNTSNVTSMISMFSKCRSLTSLDLSGWNTSNVTSMNGMFNGCNRLTSLDVSNFNTSKVTDMYSMFYDCSNLIELYLSGWDTSKVTDMIDMFKGCSNLKTIKMVGCSVDTVNNIKAQLQTDGISLDKINIITE